MKQVKGMDDSGSGPVQIFWKAPSSRNNGPFYKV